MTVSSTTTRNSYSGNGSTTTFAYGFKIFADADLTVILRASTGAETVQSLTTNYTVTNAGNANGGNVVFGTAPASGVTVVIRRNMAITQATDYVANDPFPAATHEDALDRLTFISQQMQEEVDRSIKLSRTNSMTSTEFTTSATDRASKVLSFNASGELAVTQELGTFKGDSATTTTAAFTVRDIVKATTTAQLNNIYICVADSVIGDTLTDTDHFALLVDAVSAATSATTATTKATAAASSATAAASSASTASTQASNASTSASTASTQATNAANSATAAASSATSAATALDNFDDIFLGAKSSDPSVDNDGDSLTAGDLYFNTSSNVLKVYTGSAWSTVSTFTTGISNTNIPVFTSGVADDDFLRVAGTSIEGRSASEVLSDIGASAVAGSSSIVTTGALNSGSITSGFGTIDTGSSNITTTGVGTFGSLDIEGAIDVNGTTNLDVVDIDGAVDMASSLTVTGDIISNTSGISNFRAGVNAGDSIQSGGNYNVFIGDEAGQAITTGDNNVAVGFEALSTEDTHSRNTAIGHQSLKTLNAGANAQSTAVGYNSAKAVTTGIENTFIGASSGESATTPNYTVAVGKSALGAVLTGDYNTAIGYHAGLASTSATLNTLVGAFSGDALTTGTTNCALGYLTLSAETTGQRNTAMGYSALANQNGASETQSLNTAYGFFAGLNITTGVENTFIGANAGDSCTDDDHNTFVGYNSGSAVNGGFRNTFLGKDSGDAMTTGDKNVIIGSYSGNEGGLDIRTSSNNIVLSDGDGNWRLRIDSSGDLYVPRVYDNTTGNGANVFVGSDGQLERSTSSQRYKNTINDATHGLTELLTLRPVTYKGNNDGDTVFGGLIAEEVHDAGLTEFVQYNDNGEPDALAYGHMVSLCIKAIQELKTELDSAKARIATLEAKVTALEG